MALVKVKPTSPGRRGLVKVVNANLYKGRPIDALTESKKRGSGRNNNGHITMRHKGGGHKQQYRVVDFRRTKDGIAAKVERLEYDPNRSANLALLLYTDGERRYIVAPRGVESGAQLMSGVDAPKTKLFAGKIKALGLVGTVLIVTDKLDDNVYMSSRNLPNVLVLEAAEMDPVSLVRFENVVLTKGAVTQLEEILG